MNAKQKKQINVLLSVFIVLFIFTAGAFGASAPDSAKTKEKKFQGPSKTTTSKTIKKDTTKQMRARDVLKDLPMVKITRFKKKVTSTPGTIMAARRAGSSAPTSASINYGEEITLTWIIEYRNVTNVRASITGLGNVNLGTQRTASDGTTYYTGEVTVRPDRSMRYRLTATARQKVKNVTGSPRSTKLFTVNLLKPEFDILQPSFNKENFEVAFSLRNSGEGDFRATPIQVDYEVYGSSGSRNTSITTGSFTTPRTEIESGRQVALGSISLESHRSQLYSYEAVSIRVRVGANYVLPLAEETETFRFPWEEYTAAFSQDFLDILAPVTTCDVRLNNYNSSNPRIPLANDSFVHLNMMGLGGEPSSFTIPAQRYRVRVTGKVTGHDYVDELVLFLINNIEASGGGDGPGLLSIQNGKLGLHLEFPNSGSHEIKLGTLNDRTFDDGEVPDINLGRFNVDAWLTLAIQDNRLTYSRIEIHVPTVSASLSGRFDGLNPLIRDYLSDYVTGAIQDQLNSILDSGNIKSAIENGLASALNLTRTINYLVSVRGSGSSITITYR